MAPGHQDREWESLQQADRSIRTYFRDLTGLVSQLPYASITQIVSVFLEAFVEQRTVYVFGNGGSAASASHLMCDINKGASASGDGKRPRVMALTDNTSLITAWANDFGYERIFSEQLKTFIKPRDVAFAISTSGDSPNVLLALETARQSGAMTVGLGGYQGGQMKSLCDVCAIVPSDNVQLVEDLHHAMIHSIFVAVRENLLHGTTKNLMARAASF
ncbi:MAG TPA: SIS domain-containing protein [Candidatus Angelobacter sp.]|nr:SIS domain-containing protein [Candidatus Angelobacter sp.]